MKPSFDYTEFNRSGLRNLGPVQISRIRPFYNSEVANWTRPTQNACGSAAIATLMDYWGKVPTGMKPTEIVRNIYNSEDGAPDLLFGILGTSIERVGDYQINRGLKANGYNIERKTISSIDGKFDWLRGWVDAGYPVAVIIDDGPIGSPNCAHWAVVVQMDALNKTINVANFIPGSWINRVQTDARGIVSLNPDTFLKAWEADILKIATIHYAAVISHI